MAALDLKQLYKQLLGAFSGLTHRPLALSSKILIVIALISLRWLFDGNMGLVNEADVLPLARQHVDPGWIPGDWYLNQPASYRLLFEGLAGRLIVAWGFLATSLVGRLVCYSLVATALVLIGEKLKLKFLPLVCAIALFIAGQTQGVIASEWILGRLEAKALAYGFVLLSFWLLLAGRYRWMALLLGIATSFHVLVGGWSCLIAAGTLALDPQARPRLVRQGGWLLLIYLCGSLFAIQPVWVQLVAATPAAALSPSAIYVFLRLPHHLNPLIWSAWFGRLILFLLAFGAIQPVLRRQAGALGEAGSGLEAQMQLARLTWVSLVPFLGGLLVTPFDQDGRLLQYYPFRVGDVLLPLATYLLLAAGLQNSLAQGSAAWRRRIAAVSLGLLLAAGLVQSVIASKQLFALSRFPALEPEFKQLCAWVKQETPAGSTVITSPVDFVEFTWLAERPTIAKYKLLPQTKAGILEWYERLGDLNGGSFPPTGPLRTTDHRDPLRQALRQNYYQLRPAQARALMTKYQANYFMTRTNHRLPFPVLYQNADYLIYGRPD